MTKINIYFYYLNIFNVLRKIYSMLYVKVSKQILKYTIFVVTL